MAKSLEENEKTPVVPNANLNFEEWETRTLVSMENGKKVVRFEKLHKIRPCVQITVEEAMTLHCGIIDGGNNFQFMYLLAGQKDIFTEDEINYTPL